MSIVGSCWTDGSVMFWLLTCASKPSQSGNGTLAEQVRKQDCRHPGIWCHCADTAMPRPHPAHRLDTATGGLLICSKTRSAAAALTAAFERRWVQWLGYSVSHMRKSDAVITYMLMVTLF